MKKRVFFLLLAALMPLAMNAQQNLSVHIDSTASACESFTWTVNGTPHTYTETGAYTFIVGDTLYILDLTIYSSYTVTVPGTIDGGCTFTWGDSVYETSGLHTQTFESVNGCDSTVTVNLNLATSATKNYVVTACESYIWKGDTLTTSCSRNIVDSSNPNCDSNLTLTLTVINPSSVSKDSTVSACNLYFYRFNAKDTIIYDDGIDISTDDTIVNRRRVGGKWDTTYYGKYSYSTADLINRFHPRTAERCFDSVFTMTFNIKKDAHTPIVATECDNYLIYASDTIYNITYSLVDTLKVAKAANGCDSLVDVNLTIHASPQVTISGDLRVTPGSNATLYASSNQPVSYLWSNGSSEESITITNVQENTDISLIGTSSATGCTDTANVTILANLAIDNATSANVKVYPNPTNAKVTVNAETAVKSIAVYNVNGQKVTYNENSNGIDLSVLNNGNYIVRIELVDGTVSTHAVILRK